MPIYVDGNEVNSSGYKYPAEWKTTTGDVPDQDDLRELVLAVRNRCDMFLMLHGTPGVVKLLPTLLEDMYEDVQDIVEYCIDD